MLPIKIKWLAVANALFFLWALINGGIVQRAAIIAAILHLLLFFGGDLYTCCAWRLATGNAGSSSAAILGDSIF